MRLSFGLEQRQTQKQILAPRMIQSMEILQLPIQALEARIDTELSENPLLERIEDDLMPSETEVERENPDAPTATGEKELIVDDKSGKDDFERLLDLHREIPDHFDGPRPSSNRIQQASDRQHDQIANLAARPVTLRDTLDLQLHELDLPDDLRVMAERIVSSLDSNGYLQSSLSDLLSPNATDQELALAENALEVVQSLEPAGVGDAQSARMPVIAADARKSLHRRTACPYLQSPGRPASKPSAVDRKENGDVDR